MYVSEQTFLVRESTSSQTKRNSRKRKQNQKELLKQPNKKKKKKTYAILGSTTLSLALTLSSCGVLENLNNTAKGSGIGAGAGAAIGAGIGHTAGGNAGLGAAIGAVVGGVAGGLIGNHMDKQAKELEKQVPEAKVEKVNNGECIRVTFDSGILFGFDDSVLNKKSQEALARFAENMNANPDTDIKIVGHTDNTGKHAYNMKLSERRANSVYNYLRRLNVSPTRMTSMGVGPDEPVADNSTEVGRAKNRRVEIFIIPGAEMIQKAKEEAGNK